MSDTVDIIRRMPRARAQKVASGILHLLSWRPDLRMLYSPADIAFLESLGDGKARYAKGGKWITIGGHKGSDGKRSGGSPVYIENGRITKGHPSLTGKSIKNLDAPAEGVGTRKAATMERDHARAVWAKKAKKEGIDPEHLHELAGEIKAHHDAHVNDVNSMLKDVYAAHPHLKTATLSSNRGGDSAAMKKLDTISQSYAHRSEYNHLFGGYDADVDGDKPVEDYSEKMYEYLLAGKPQPMDENDAYEQAMEQLQGSRWGGPKDDSPVPFAKGSADPALAEWYAGHLNALLDAGEPVTADALDQIAEELEPTGGRLDYARQRWAADDLLQYAAERAPKGGVSIGGVTYRGGQFIPGDVLAKAPENVKQKVKAASQQRKLARASRGTPDVAGLKKRLSPHATKLEGKDLTAAERSYRMLKDHHGDLTHHRIEELIDETERAHAKATGDVKATLSRRLAALNHMLSVKDEAKAKDEGAGSADPRLPKLAAKLKTWEDEELDARDVVQAALAYESMKADYGDHAADYIEDRAGEHIEQLNRLPKGAKANREHHRKQLAVLAWFTDRLQKEKPTVDKEPDFREAIDRIVYGENARTGKTHSGAKVSTPWSAFLLNAIASEFAIETNPKRDDYVPMERVWNDLKAGKFWGPRMDKVLRAIPREYGTMSQGQLRKVLPHLKERADTIKSVADKVVPKAKAS